MTTTTTLPMTTTTKAAVATSTKPSVTLPPMEDDSCTISIPDYNVLRQQNIKKINDYYDNLLSSYSKDYQEYARQLTSANINDRSYASTKLKPKLGNYDEQIIKVSKNLMERVNTETDLIGDQKKSLNDKIEKVEALREEIKLIKKQDKEASNISNSNNDTIKQSKKKIRDLEIINYIYITGNIILLLVCLYILF